MKKLVSVLFGICVIVHCVSLVMTAISLNPDVKWNEFNKEVFDGYFGYYFHTLGGSIDAYAYDQTDQSTELTSKTSTRFYVPMLDLDTKEGYKFHNGMILRQKTRCM